EVAHLAGERDRRLGGVEAGDRARGRPPCRQLLPERGDVVAGRCLDSEPGDDDARATPVVQGAHASAPTLASTRSTACPTVVTPSRSSSGTEMSKRSSSPITISP